MQAKSKLMALAQGNLVLERSLDAWWKYFVVEPACSRVVSQAELSSADLCGETMLEHERRRVRLQIGEYVAREFTTVQETNQANRFGGNHELVARAWVIRP